MKRLPHWFKAASGLRIGLAKLATYDGAMIRALDVRTFEHMRAAQQRYMVAVAALEDFSTRDYAYDVGGWQASDAYLDEYRFVVWERAS